MVDIIFYIFLSIIFIGFLHGLGYMKDIKEKKDNEIENKINNILDENKKLNDKIKEISLSIDNFKQQIQNINENYKKEEKGIKIIYKKGRNSEINTDKKYCNFPRSRNRGNCKTIIYKYENGCSKHKNNFLKNINNNENKDEKVTDDLNLLLLS